MRRYSLAMIVLGLLFFYGALLSQSGCSTMVNAGAQRKVEVNDVVQAHAFVLLDDKGNKRAELGVNPRSGNTGLFLFNADGHKVAEFDVDQGNDPGLRLLDADGAERVSLDLSGKYQLPNLSMSSYAVTSGVVSHDGVLAVSIGVGNNPGQPARIEGRSGSEPAKGFVRVWDGAGRSLLKEQ